MVPVLIQVAGALLATAGLYVLFGVGVTLLVVGAALLAVGVALELLPPDRREPAAGDERHTS
jgi:hypothetical protein